MTIEDVFAQGGRVAVASSCGYMDARAMVDLSQTHGFPLSLSALKCREHGLKVDFQALRHELILVGKKPETIDSELAEVRFFMEVA